MLSFWSQKLKKKETSPEEILDEYLTKIKKFDEKIGAFIEVEEEDARNWAKEAKKRWEKGQNLSDYDGIPIGIKDNIVTQGRKVSCASKILEGYISPFSATVIERLQALGFNTMGRLNMDEFAMGSSTENSAYKITRNPHDLSRSPGGSSGGSAAAVAAGFVPAALGSDTGGSIRQPASFCGIYGLKPTYGTVSRYGLVAFASSLDQIGPLTLTASDARLLYECIKGHDPRDSTTIPASKYRVVQKPIEELRIGYSEELLDGCQSEVKKSFEELTRILRKEVIKSGDLFPIHLPHQKYGIAVYYITATSEASANLARFDGIRYGYRYPSNNLLELYEKSRTIGFGTEVKRRILLGTFALSSGYYDAYYAQAQKVRRLIRQDYLNAFQEVDLILLPTSPTVAFLLGEKTHDPVQMYLSDIFTVGASLAGIPALSIPGPTQGLPIGMQLQGPYFSENLLLDLAQKLETAYGAKMAKLG
ncbi:MAG: Asp-tRNA(Asn)/Glu-tRNA(Gln) amidotransferase subunit GatA [Leptospiraceae bacterium]|nr:Asp-tRNA(Asn)/Glu-tRNA(Gln) amidotransferase subunit GatA [Leptospiraceae bacterium]MDW8306967.1 Asp-tRNA(Asn)/Glu-tRNA(Gln) amidotransferase subunit GatA [Leptospiraceae bacterium]